MSNPVRYRGRCPTCNWTGREFTKLKDAEDAAADHARLQGHTTHVIDHYDMHVVGTTVEPPPGA